MGGETGQDSELSPVSKTVKTKAEKGKEDKRVQKKRRKKRPHSGSAADPLSSSESKFRAPSSVGKGESHF